MARGAGGLLPRAGGAQRVTFMELFFDLVYALAVTQLSHVLLGHLSVGGAGQTGTAREALWLAAVVVDLVAPALRFYAPGLGRSRTTDWPIVGTHLAERCQGFLILALGESLLVAGAAFGDLPLSTATEVAFVVALASSVALWWVYFDRSAEDAGGVIAGSATPAASAGRPTPTATCPWWPASSSPPSGWS